MSATKPRYPWSEGDALYADELNAAIANAGGGSSVPAGGSIQAAIDALPMTGGVITLLSNTTYAISAQIEITKPNVTISAPTWGTVLQRANGAFANVVHFAPAATNGRLVGVTVDGNNVTGASGEVYAEATGCVIERCQFIRSTSTAVLGFGADDTAALYNTIVGLGSSGLGQYGIWAINNKRVRIERNHISNTFLDAIGFDGTGSVCSGNEVHGCHWDTITAGGQIASYPHSVSCLIEMNSIGPGGAPNAGGLEVNGNHISIVGNTIYNSHAAGLSIDASPQDGVTMTGFLITGNTIKNSGQSARNAGCSIGGAITGVCVVGNCFIDDQVTPTQSAGLVIGVGVDAIIVHGNDLSGNLTAPIVNNAAGTATRHYIGANLGAPPINAANDAAAASAGVAVGTEYRNGSIKMVRVA